MNALAEYWQNEVQAKYDEKNAASNANQAQQAKKNEFVSLSFWAGEFTYKDSEKTVKGEISKDDYAGHVARLVARATEIAQERKCRLSVSDCGSVDLTASKDFSK